MMCNIENFFVNANLLLPVMLQELSLSFIGLKWPGLLASSMDLAKHNLFVIKRMINIRRDLTRLF